ncbi:PepSY domain-containing protein [Leptotrichia buccalis]|uniref:Propeptide PepSY amd peptidase M4 n=1 Tax=Leptotrichia buccalis (strain ATCC 14201 / DSM 1135 / JCM 12969 / NCTC 10249 / C-1013-b) TaxID=523794 RepID=C7NBE5_LEPBD|nr:PepSY domain-containing protein [Leptotrichia buccalis]ACV39476.1 Propeptide PepSY amd peptidase M4 [Leptotrichia buccalis C-1013-b]
MKKKILSIALLSIMVLGVSVATNAKSKNKYNRNIASNSYIGVNRAMNIALKKVPGANSSHMKKIHLDRENGRMVYEGEIYYNGQEYEFDIDAVTGDIVKWKVEGVSNNSPYANSNANNSQNITIEKAKSIALAQVRGASQSHFGKIELDHDHGRAIYEIEIFYNNSKYEFDIDASTGEVIGTEVKHYNRNY